jgi:hypothetical protein
VDAQTISQSRSSLPERTRTYSSCAKTRTVRFSIGFCSNSSAPHPRGRYMSSLSRASKTLPLYKTCPTNVDRCLEQSLGTTDVIERTDLERCNSPSLIAQDEHLAQSTVTGHHFSVASTRPPARKWLLYQMTRGSWQSGKGCLLLLFSGTRDALDNAILGSFPKN